MPSSWDFLGFYALFDFIKSSRGESAASSGGGHDAHGGPSGVTGVAVKVQNLNIPPMIGFDEDLGDERFQG